MFGDTGHRATDQGWQGSAPVGRLRTLPRVLADLHPRRSCAAVHHADPDFGVVKFCRPAGDVPFARVAYD